ncbi:MAG: nitrogenase component 1 [Deltaproteobacteria bacterium]|nr:nitrogenase component 1 [Deltaproteobacteria bacterium]
MSESKALPVLPNEPPQGTGESEPDFSQPVVQSYMIGIFLGVNAIEDTYLLVEGPDCIHMKTQYVQGNHDWLSTLTSVSGYHRVANTALHPVEMTASRERELSEFLQRMAARDHVDGLLFTSMPMAFITGADYDRLCSEVGEATGKTIVPIAGKSLSGDFLDGYAEVLQGLAKALPLEGGEPDPKKVALIGNLFDRNEGDNRGNVRHLRELIEGLGVEVTSIWLEGRRFHELSAVKDAGVVVSLPYGRRAAKRVARRTGAKLVESPLPFGLEATEQMLRLIAETTGTEDRLPSVLDRGLAEVIPSLEWIQPFMLQGRKVGFVGDPHLAEAMHQALKVVGAELVVAVITNYPHHARKLAEKLGSGVELIVGPRQMAMSRQLSEAMNRLGVDLLVANSEGANVGPEIASVELGFPSIYTHALYDRPFLGFQGFLAFVDSWTNATRRNELYRHHAKYMKGGAGDGGQDEGRKKEEVRRLAPTA